MGNQINRITRKSRLSVRPVSAVIGLALFMVLVLLAPGSAGAATGAKYIRNDSNGGDCASIGSWDKSTKTCTLTTDLTFSGTDGIEIASNGVALNGNGHTLTGTKGSPWRSGVYLNGKSNVTVRNLNIKQFNIGIRLENSSGNILSNNIASSNSDGIWLWNSTGNTLTGNTASSNSLYGVFLDDSTGNTLTDNTASLNSSSGIFLYSSSGSGSTGNTLNGNTASSNYDGIALDSSCGNNTLIGNTASSNSWYGIFLVSDNNTLSGNTASSTWTGIFLFASSGNILTGNTASNSNYGIYLYDYNAYDLSSNNKIYRNNFLGNSRQAFVFGGSANLFSLPAPIGGNYWSNYDSPDEGCSDANGDGFCDYPYVFRGGQDGLPRTTPENCGKPRLAVTSKVLRWDSYMDFVNRRLTATYTIKNSSAVNANSVAVKSSVSNNKVGLITKLPLRLPDMLSEGTAAFELKYQIPLTVTSFHTATTLEAQDGCQNDFGYEYEYDEAVPLPQ